MIIMILIMMLMMVVVVSSLDAMAKEPRPPMLLTHLLFQSHMHLQCCDGWSSFNKCVSMVRIQEHVGFFGNVLSMLIISYYISVYSLFPCRILL